jgi:hypothetical protein
MNTDAKTVFTRPALEESEMPTPYCYFNSFAEAEQFAWELHRADSSLEMSLYRGDEYIQTIPPMQKRLPVKMPQRRGFWSFLRARKRSGKGGFF